MQTILAVLEDLFNFVKAALFGVRTEMGQDVGHLSNGMQQTLLATTQTPHTQRLPSFVPHIPAEGDAKGVVYFVGDEVALHADPVMAFDVVSEILSYGTPVHLLKLGGRWAYIRVYGREGWILKDTLREQARDVLPEFVHGVLYDTEHEETKKLRRYIKDAFCGGKAGLLLTDAEYVTYKLYQKGLSLPWNSDRPRTPGTWQKKLRGKNGVHIGIQPKVNAVMEYIIEDIGYVAFVEAVFPDGSLKQSGVGLLGEGVYSESIQRAEEWRELRPVFITVH